MDKMQEITGWAGAALTICNFLFPVFTYMNVIKGRLSYDNTPSFFVITSYINYFCMYVYGDMVFSDQVKYAYLVGSIINCILMTIYLIYEIRKFLIDTILNALLIITGTWALYRCLTIMIDDDRTVGKICILTFIVVYITPIQILYKVLKEKNYNLIPIYNCWVSFFSSIFWVIYSMYLSDFYKTKKLIEDATGVSPKYFRFPGGGNNHYLSSSLRSQILNALHKEGYTAIDWNAGTSDAASTYYSESTLIRNGKSSHWGKGPIILLQHDSNAKYHTPAVTKALIQYYRSKGYTFANMDHYYGPELCFKK